jgi:hypothetical protein
MGSSRFWPTGARSCSQRGKLLSLSFVLFAGWLSGFPLSDAQYPGFLVTGTFSSFASTFVAVPFLLELNRIPSDAFRLRALPRNSHLESDRNACYWYPDLPQKRPLFLLT